MTTCDVRCVFLGTRKLVIENVPRACDNLN